MGCVGVKSPTDPITFDPSFLRHPFVPQLLGVITPFIWVKKPSCPHVSNSHWDRGILNSLHWETIGTRGPLLSRLHRLTEPTVHTSSVRLPTWRGKTGSHNGCGWQNPGTLKTTGFLMDAWWTSYFSCQDLESSHWNTHSSMDVSGSRLLFFEIGTCFSVINMHLKWNFLRNFIMSFVTQVSASVQKFAASNVAAN